MIMITVTILASVLVYKSFCNTVCIYMVMQIKLVVVVVVAFHASRMTQKMRPLISFLMSLLKKA